MIAESSFVFAMVASGGMAAVSVSQVRTFVVVKSPLLSRGADCRFLCGSRKERCCFGELANF